MNLSRKRGHWPRFDGRSRKSSNRASALVIVLVLLSFMATLIISNSIALRRLQVELKALEAKQIRATAERSAVLSGQKPD